MIAGLAMLLVVSLMARGRVLLLAVRFVWVQQPLEIVDSLSVISLRTLNVKVRIEQEDIPDGKLYEVITISMLSCRRSNSKAHLSWLLNYNKVTLSNGAPSLFLLLAPCCRFPSKSAATIPLGHDAEETSLVLCTA